MQGGPQLRFAASHLPLTRGREQEQVRGEAAEDLGNQTGDGADLPPRSSSALCRGLGGV